MSHFLNILHDKGLENAQLEEDDEEPTSSKVVPDAKFREADLASVHLKVRYCVFTTDVCAPGNYQELEMLLNR